MTIEEIISRLDAKKNGTGHKAKCPGHDDGTASLSVSTGRDGRVLLKCFAGCTTEQIVDALGIKISDLFAEAPKKSREPITVGALAGHKKLPAEHLRALGLRDAADGSVLIPYRDIEGNEVALKRRTALVAKDGSIWPKGKPLFPYGLDRLADARELDYLVIVEGESDCWTLWYHSIPALGIPGATSAKVVLAEHLGGIAKVYFVREPDKGGDTFAAKVPKRLAELKYAGSVHELRLDGVKDPSELHSRDPKAFKASFEKALEAAATMAPQVTSEPYTAAEIANYAAKQGSTIEEFRYRWIIQDATAFYVFCDGKYLSPILKGALSASLKKRDLTRVPARKDSPAGIEWTVANKKGELRWKTTDEILRDYATVARKTVVSMTEPTSKYDAASQTFHEAACPLRPIVPKYDEQIGTWLRLLGGRDAERLLDWVATITRLDRVTCAIYIDGPKGAGKNMFAEGLARLWGNVATELQSLTGNFNSALLNSPLVFADEQVPRNMSSGFLRNLVGSSSRALRRKFMPEAELLGAVRVVIAANNPDLLKFDDEDFSEEDIKAVAARIFYVKPDPTTADYLCSIGGRSATQGWVEGGDKIAAHALWLRDHRSVTPGSRFLVEGEISTIHRRLATRGSIRGWVIEWVAKAMLSNTHPANPGILFGNGNLYINTGYVQKTWEKFLDDKRVPSLSKIGKALKPLSRGERRLKYLERRADFYDLHLAPVCEAVQELQIIPLEDFRALIDASSEHF